MLAKNNQDAFDKPPLDAQAESSTYQASYRPEVDGLRALAVIAVIVNHFDPAIIPSGFLGVDIFFVISGFFVTASLCNKTDQSWQDYLLTFYAKRVKRLIPALLVCVTITSLLGCVVIAYPNASLYTGIASLFGVSNLFLLRQSIDYFGESAELNLFTQTWSLGVEEQFYILFPILLGICGFSRQKRKGGEKNLLFALLALSTLSLIGYIYLSQTNFAAAFFLMPARFWELGLGSLTFLAVRRFFNQPLGALKVWIALLSILLLVSVLFVSQDFQTLSTLATAGLTALLLWSLDQKSLLVSALSSRRIVYIGHLSYSLYLWHWSVLVLSRWTIGISAWTIPLQLILIAGMATISYRWIEQPLRHAQWSKTKLKTIGNGLGITFVIALTLIGLAKPFAGILYSGHFFADSEAKLSELATGYKPCSSLIPASKSFAECTFPPKASITNSDQTIYFVGDSHTGALKALAARLVENNNVPSVVMVSGKGCLFSTSLVREREDGRQYNSCLDSNLAFVSEVMETGKRGDIVVVASRYKPFFLSPNYPRDLSRWRKGDFALRSHGARVSPQAALEEHSQELVDISGQLLSKGISLVVQAPLPDWKHLPYECQPQWFRPSLAIPKTCVLDASLESQARAPVLTSFQRAEAASDNLFVYDPFPVFCSSKTCEPLADDGSSFFQDDNHLNTYGAEYLYERFVGFLNERSLLQPEVAAATRDITSKVKDN